MLRFKISPDAVFQAILRESINYAIGVISDLLSVHNYKYTSARDGFTALFPETARLFSPSLARYTLMNMRRCLEKPEIYHLGNYHYLLLYEVLGFYADIHNGLVAASRSFKKKKEASFVDPFYIEQINSERLFDLYFFDLDFLLDAESQPNAPDRSRGALSAEAPRSSRGLTPYPDDLVLRIDTDLDPMTYKVTSSRCFGPISRKYPDFRHDSRHSEQ